jgi:Protein of unknown function (DUF2800)
VDGASWQLAAELLWAKIQGARLAAHFADARYALRLVLDMTAHAKLSPSSAKRWFSCPGSVRASAGIASEGSVFAAEGTAAHALAAYCLENGFDAVRLEGEIIDAKTGRIGVEIDVDGIRYFEVTDEMVEAVQTYLDLCRRFMLKPWEYDIEQKLDLSSVHKDVFGTGDFISYHPDTKALIVADFKYGKGVAVKVEENEQLLTYALGAAMRFHNRGLSGLDLYVVQPRCPIGDDEGVRWANYDAIDLAEFQSLLQQKAKATEAHDAPFLAGEHCRFCPIAATCDTLRASVLAGAESEFAESGGEAAALSADRTAALLRQAGFIKDWIKRVEAFAQSEAQHGRLPTGFKLVAKRATRKWKNPDEAKTYLETVVELDESDIYHEPKMKSPAQIEGVLGKKRKGEIADLWESISSGTNLVPIEDTRPAAKPDAESEFA